MGVGLGGTVWLPSAESSYIDAQPLVLDGGAVGIA